MVVAVAHEIDGSDLAVEELLVQRRLLHSALLEHLDDRDLVCKELPEKQKRGLTAFLHGVDGLKRALS